MKEKKSVCLLISAIVGTLYAMYSMVYWLDFGEQANNALAVGLATALVGPHVICTVMAVVFNWVGYGRRSPGMALAGAILYTVAALLFAMYAVFVILEAILSYVGFANLRKILSDEAQAKRRSGPRPRPMNGPELDDRPAVDVSPREPGGMSDEEVDALLAEEERHKKVRFVLLSIAVIGMAAIAILYVTEILPSQQEDRRAEASLAADDGQELEAEDAAPEVQEPAPTAGEADIVAAFAGIVPEDAISVSDSGGITTVSLEDAESGVELLRAKTEETAPEGWTEFTAQVVAAAAGISPLPDTSGVSVLVKDAPGGDIYLTITNGAIVFDEFEESDEDAPQPFAMEQQQAIDKAKEYLEVLAFSRTGLIEQLEYSGFTQEAAVYGADNCGANWNEQAARKAQEYLDVMAFSRQGLIDQLIYSGFSSSEAEYGVQAVGY